MPPRPEIYDYEKESPDRVGRVFIGAGMVRGVTSVLHHYEPFDLFEKHPALETLYGGVHGIATLAVVSSGLVWVAIAAKNR